MWLSDKSSLFSTYITCHIMLCRDVCSVIGPNTFPHPSANLGLASYFLPVFRQRIVESLWTRLNHTGNERVTFQCNNHFDNSRALGPLVNNSFLVEWALLLLWKTAFVIICHISLPWNQQSNARAKCSSYHNHIDDM